LATLVSAAAAYAIVSSLVSIAGGDSSHANHTSAPASHGAVGAPAAPAWLGVDTTDLLGANGAMVVNVSPGSPAAAAGLEPGDVITQINGRPVQTAADLESILASMNAGDRVEIQYDRGPAVTTAHATLAARPGNGP
jgi:S1-C subfamily serine protease